MAHPAHTITMTAEYEDVLITGFPGFVGTRLVRTLVSAQPEQRFALVVEPRFETLAIEVCEQIQAADPSFEGRWRVLPGDIREPGLGVATEHANKLRETVRHVWHVAAIYDLAVPKELAEAVNVTGTERVLDFCASAPNLERLFHTSSIVVAGDREGHVSEAELDEGQSFRNHYESTKFASEVAVRKRRDSIPTVIFRPGVVVGDSVTGVTPKADGPYLMVRAALRTPAFLPYAQVGSEVTRMHIVPVDFLVNAMVHISAQDSAVGQTFQVTDTNPMTMHEYVNLTLAALGRKPASQTVSKAAVERVLKFKFIQKLAGIPLESLNYVDQDVSFDTSNLRAALGDQLACPPLADYWPRLVQWLVRHPEI